MTVRTTSMDFGSPVAPNETLSPYASVSPSTDAISGGSAIYERLQNRKRSSSFGWLAIIPAAVVAVAAGGVIYSGHHQHVQAGMQTASAQTSAQTAAMNASVAKTAATSANADAQAANANASTAAISNNAAQAQAQNTTEQAPAATPAHQPLATRHVIHRASTTTRVRPAADSAQDANAETPAPTMLSAAPAPAADANSGAGNSVSTSAPANSSLNAGQTPAEPNAPPAAVQSAPSTPAQP